MARDAHHGSRPARVLSRSNAEGIMSILIDIIGLLAVLANGLFALHVWAGVATSASARS